MKIIKNTGTGQDDNTKILKNDGTKAGDVGGTGDMEKSVYDTNSNDIVDMSEDSQQLDGKAPSYYDPETAQTIGDLISGSTEKTTPVDNDRFGYWDSVADILKYVKWSNIKSVLKTYFDTQYPAETTTTIGSLINGATSKTTPVDADYVGLMDSAASNILKKLSWANIKATLNSVYQPLDSDLTTIAGLTATTDNFIQSKSSAWASRTVAQVKTDLSIRSLMVLSPYLLAAPLDSTTYYFSSSPAAPPETTEIRQRIYFSCPCTLRSVIATAYKGAGVGSSENVSLYVRKNATTDTTISTTWQWTSAFGIDSVTATGLSTTFAAGDWFTMKMVTPAWATNPANVYFVVTLEFEVT